MCVSAETFTSGVWVLKCNAEHSQHLLLEGNRGCNKGTAALGPGRPHRNPQPGDIRCSPAPGSLRSNGTPGRDLCHPHGSQVPRSKPCAHLPTFLVSLKWFGGVIPSPPCTHSLAVNSFYYSILLNIYCFSFAQLWERILLCQAASLRSQCQLHNFTQPKLQGD